MYRAVYICGKTIICEDGCLELPCSEAGKLLKVFLNLVGGKKQCGPPITWLVGIFI